MRFGSFHFYLDSILGDHVQACLSDQKGQLLHLKNSHPFDNGAWSDAMKMALQYFPMLAGDILVFNDASAGGHDPSVFSFITCLQKPQDQAPGLYLGFRRPGAVSLKDLFKPQSQIFRVPFTPIVQAGEIQGALIEAMSSSPMAPKNLAQLLNEEIGKGLSTWRRFQNMGMGSFNNKFIQTYLTEVHDITLRHFKEKPWGETRAEMTLDTGEVIKLAMEIGAQGLKLDFGGSSPGQEFFMSANNLAGVCRHYFANYFSLKNFGCEGFSSAIQVSQPTTSCLNARAQQPTRRAYLLGSRLIYSLLETAAMKIHPKPPRGVTNYCGLWVQAEFKNRSNLNLYLPNGSGAQAEAEGVTGLDIFGESAYLSPEHLESQWPVRWLRIDVRNSMMGKGKVSGGRGLIQNFEVLDEGQLYWLTDLSQNRLPVQKHQTSPDRTEVLVKQGEETQSWSTSGSCPVKVGDQVILGSGSGGGLL